MNDLPIPEKSVTAALQAFDTAKGTAEQAMRVAIMAAIAAWPGGKNDPWWDLMTHKKRVSIILPLPTETEND